MTAHKSRTSLSIPQALRKLLLSACGLIALALGIMGAVLPLLPTTPFLLLAALCFYHGSERLHHWLQTRPWVGKQLHLWREHHAITKTVKWTALSYLWLSIGITISFFLTQNIHRLLLLMVAIAVTLHLLRLKTLPMKALHKQVSCLVNDSAEKDVKSEKNK